jgi:hypothetical protein
LKAEGFGVTIPSSGDILWIGAGLGGFAGFHLGDRLRAVLQAEVLVPWSRPRFFFRNVPTNVYQSSRVAATVTVGPELLF